MSDLRIFCLRQERAALFVMMLAGIWHLVLMATLTKKSASGVILMLTQFLILDKP